MLKKMGLCLTIVLLTKIAMLAQTILIQREDSSSVGQYSMAITHLSARDVANITRLIATDTFSENAEHIVLAPGFVCYTTGELAAYRVEFSEPCIDEAIANRQLISPVTRFLDILQSYLECLSINDSK